MSLMALLAVAVTVFGVVAGAVAFAPAPDAEAPRSPTTLVGGEAQFLHHE